MVFNTASNGSTTGPAVNNDTIISAGASSRVVCRCHPFFTAEQWRAMLRAANSPSDRCFCLPASTGHTSSSLRQTRPHRRRMSGRSSLAGHPKRTALPQERARMPPLAFPRTATARGCGSSRDSWLRLSLLSTRCARSPRPKGARSMVCGDLCTHCSSAPVLILPRWCLCRRMAASIHLTRQVSHVTPPRPLCCFGAIVFFFARLFIPYLPGAAAEAAAAAPAPSPELATSEENEGGGY